MKLVVLLLLFLSLASPQMNHNMRPAKVIPSLITPEVMTVPSKHKLSISYPFISYQIQAQLYQSADPLLSEQIYDKQSYSSSSSCQYFPTELSINTINDISLADGTVIESYLVSQNTQKKIVYLLYSDNSLSSTQNVTNRSIHLFSFTQDSSTHVDTVLSISKLGLNDSELNDIKMTEFSDVLLVTDGVKIVVVNTSDFSVFWSLNQTNKGGESTYDFASSNQLLKFQFCHDQFNDLKFHLIWDSKIDVFQISANKKQSTFLQRIYVPKETKLFIDVDYEYRNYFALVEKHLLIYQFQPDTNDYKLDKVSLESTFCSQINKLDSTIHLVCKENQISYVAEIYYNEKYQTPSEALTLNRYYTEVDDVKNVFVIGEDRDDPFLLISGDEDLMLTSYAINRQVLLDMEGEQNIDRFQSLGIQDVEYIYDFSQENSTYLVGIGVGFVIFFQINQVDPIMECTLDRKDGVRSSILLAINVTSCPENGDFQQLNSICEVLIPYTIYVSILELEKSKGLTVKIVVFAFMFIIVLLILGCAFKRNGLINRAMAQVNKKIEKIRNKKKETKPI